MKTVFDLRLAHYHASPVLSLDNRAYEQDVRGSYYSKPVGFWVSVEGGDDGWKEWSLAENFGTEGLAVEHRVSLAADARILLLTGAYEIDDFTARFGKPTDLPPLSRRDWPPTINWKAVAEAYQGIIIAPYCYERRLDDKTSWYYPWDCASGCIWDVSAIASISPVTP